MNMYEKIENLKKSLDALKSVYSEDGSYNVMHLDAAAILSIHCMIATDADVIKTELRKLVALATYEDCRKAAGYPDEFWRLIPETKFVDRIKALREQYGAENIGLAEAKYIVTGTFTV